MDPDGFLSWPPFCGGRSNPIPVEVRSEDVLPSRRGVAGESVAGDSGPGHAACHACLGECPSSLRVRKWPLRSADRRPGAIAITHVSHRCRRAPPRRTRSAVARAEARRPPVLATAVNRLDGGCRDAAGERGPCSSSLILFRHHRPDKTIRRGPPPPNSEHLRQATSS